MWEEGKWILHVEPQALDPYLQQVPSRDAFLDWNQYAYSIISNFFAFSRSFRNDAWGKIAAGTGVGWILGAKFHSSRLTKKLNEKHKKDQKALYTQYYNDVYSLQQQNQELAQALEQMGVRVQ